MRLLDNEDFQREDLAQALANLRLDPNNPQIPLIKPPFRFMDHQLLAINWMALMEDGFAGGGLLADDCGLGKVTRQLL
jgi:SNF2 family DNA or RNA helicase